MKLIELQEPPTIWKDNIYVMDHTTKLQYDNVIVHGDFDCSHTAIKTLKGCPIEVTGDFDCSNTAIRTLKGAPRKIGGQVNCEQTNITRLHNVHKFFQELGGLFVMPSSVTSHILGFLMIRGDFWVAPDQYTSTHRADRLGKAIRILNKQLY